MTHTSRFSELDLVPYVYMRLPCMEIRHSLKKKESSVLLYKAKTSKKTLHSVTALKCWVERLAVCIRKKKKNEKKKTKTKKLSTTKHEVTYVASFPLAHVPHISLPSNVSPRTSQLAPPPLSADFETVPKKKGKAFHLPRSKNAKKKKIEPKKHINK